MLTIAIITKNEERSLRDCLKSLEGLDAEIVVVDSGSTDDTTSIAESMGAQVVQFRWNGEYPKKKEWCLRNVGESEWMLLLDADERLSDELRAEISKVVAAKAASADAYDVKLDYKFLGKNLKYGHRVVKRILLRRSTARFPKINDLEISTMWEVEGHYQPTIDGKVSYLSGKLRHEDQDPLFDWFSRHNRYSDWESRLRLSPGLRAEVRDVRSAQGKLFDSVPYKPLIVFMYSYFLRRGFLDGQAGFHYAVAQAFYQWQITAKTIDSIRV